VSDLDPYVKIKLDADKEVHKMTSKKKDTGANVIWDEELSFGKVVDDLGFVTFVLW